jgi:hypothetical protein
MSEAQIRSWPAHSYSPVGHRFPAPTACDGIAQRSSSAVWVVKERTFTMTDPRNIKHDKKVQQEKKHKHQEIKPGAQKAVQPGQKPKMAPRPETSMPEPQSSSTEMPDTGDKSGS